MFITYATTTFRVERTVLLAEPLLFSTSFTFTPHSLPSEFVQSRQSWLGGQSYLRVF